MPELLYQGTPTIANADITATVQRAAARLYKKLAKLDTESLDINAYTREYLNKRLHALAPALQLYSHILLSALARFDSPIDQLSLIDYGGGTGLLSLLAKEAGLGTVLYNDIYDVSCADARTIAHALGIEVDDFIVGDVDEVLDYCRMRGSAIDIMASYDVIEHIYDIEGFLKKIAQSPNAPAVLSMSSGANTYNPGTRRSLSRFQRMVEYQGQSGDAGHKGRDSLQAYFTIRRNLIQGSLQRRGMSLADDTITRLARLTRGKKVEDIETALDAFIARQEWPKPLRHATNTCDPLTGNWAEHLMDPFDLQRQLVSSGWHAEIRCGYYASPRHPLKRTIGRAVNRLIGSLGTCALPFAQYFTLYAWRDADRSPASSR